nr:hypothetical protein [Tanacetum cinerariifolium]
MTKDLSILRRNKVNWHYVRDDQMFTIIKLVSRHQNTQQFSAILPIELTNEDIRNSAAYKEYYAVASGAAPPRLKRVSGRLIVVPTLQSLLQRLHAQDSRLQQKANNLLSLPKQKVYLCFLRTGILPGVPDVPTDESDEEISWKSSDEHDDDEVDDRSGNDDASLGMNVGGKEGHDAEDDDEELYRDVNINLEGRDVQMTNVHTTQEFEDTHVTLTSVNPDGQQQSSVSSQFVTSMLNPSPDASIDSLFESTPRVDVQALTTVAPLTLTTPNLPPLTIPTISQVPQVPTPLTTAPSTFLHDLLNFGSLFRFDHRLKTLEANFSEFVQTNQFARAVSFILRIVERYMDQRMNEAIKIIKEQVKVQVSKILPKIEKLVNEQLEAEVLTRSSNSSKTSYVVAADLSKLELKTILIEKIESNKSIYRLDEQTNLYKALVDAYKCDKLILNTYGDTVTLKRRRDDADKNEEPSAGSDRGSKRRREVKKPESTSAPKEKMTKTTDKSTEGSKSHQKTTSDDLAKQADSRSSFNELMDTHIDFLAFLMNRLKVDTLTPELLAGPTYDLMKGSYKILVELKFFLEEMYMATTDQLDWNNSKGQQYPHNLLKPLPLIPNSQGHYRHIKGIEDLVPHTMWSQEPVSYDKYALWGISHWERKRQRFYRFKVNREFARDVYSKRRIIAVIKLQIVEWHDYKHLDWTTVRRDDDKLYKFKEGDFKRLLIQDIEDMLLLLVQGKLTNLTVEEHFTFNVSLRMFTRIIVIQRHVEDLQLGVKSYQKNLNLTKPIVLILSVKKLTPLTLIQDDSSIKIKTSRTC